MKVGLFVASWKGYNFLRRFQGHPAVVASYESKGLREDPYPLIQQYCARYGIPFCHRKQIEPQFHAECDVVIVAGWQFLLSEIDKRFVIFHDSLLPRYRGFSPTVAALLDGAGEIGVTAFYPVPAVDAGPILGWRAIANHPAMKIGEAYEKLGHAYASLAQEIVAAVAAGEPEVIAQDESSATYTQWRDEADYLIDWRCAASEIKRMVDALGWPYLGAKTAIAGAEIRIDEAEVIPDASIVRRVPGKLWSVGEHGFDVVCGEGLLHVSAVRGPAANWRPNTIRLRFDQGGHYHIV